MKRTKEQKGITLIALIITIVVLMILAAVAINSITNDGIISKAESVKNTYTEAQNEEQKMLDYYELVLSGTAWTQNGTTVTRGTDTFKVGEKVNLKVGTADPLPYSDSIASGAEGDYTGDWVVLGAEYGKLLLVSASNVEDSVALSAANGGNFYGTEYVAGYCNGVEYLHNLCSKYKNDTYADSARSITAEDINRVTGFKPEDYPGYGETFTCTIADIDNGNCFGYYHVDGRVLGESGVDSITETSSGYEYEPADFFESTLDPAYVALFASPEQFSGNNYWVATQWTSAHYWTYWGLFVVGSANDNFATFNTPALFSSSSYGQLWSSWEQDYSGFHGARAVVSIKPEVQVQKAS